MRSGIDAQSRQVNNDTELAHHQVRALSRIGGQVNPGAKCAHQDADNDRTASNAQLDRRVHARQEASRFGLSSRFISLPNILPTLFTEFASPTIVNRSPICRRRFLEASRSMPARFTRVILIP